MIHRLLIRLRGVLEMLAMRMGWRARFDVSAAAFWESFFAALPALPFFVLSIMGQNAVAAALADDPALVRPVGLAQGAVLYLCLWAYFPLVARGITGFFNLHSSFVPWVVVHNWTVLLLLGIQGTAMGLVLLGALSPQAYVDFGGMYFLFAIYAHCRAAIGSLQAPWPLAIAAACAPILIWLILQLILAYTFAGAALYA